MNDFEKNIYSLYKEKGTKWLLELPSRVQYIADEWSLSNIIPYDNLSYNYVACAKQNKKDVVLKLGLDYSGLQREADALKVYNGKGSIRIYGRREEALLLERCIPGESLKHICMLQSDIYTSVASIIPLLHSAPVNSACFPSLESWTTQIYKTWDIPDTYCMQARNIHAHLLQTTTLHVLLHGDLHYDNILQHRSGWVAIDPKGIVGDPAYEISVTIISTAASLQDKTDIKKLILRDIVSYAYLLKMDPKRIAQWSFVHVVIAWIWALEENTPIEVYPEITEVCASILKNEFSGSLS